MPPELRKSGKSPLSNLNFYKIMKPNRFLRLFLLLFAAGAGIYLFSCQRDAEPADTKSVSNTPFTERACGAGECECTITIDSTVTVDICGDLPQFANTCTACGDNNKLGQESIAFEAGVSRTICVQQLGEFCIRNRPTNADTIVITVQFGSSTPVVSPLILPGQTQCFHTNADCTSSLSGCN